MIFKYLLEGINISRNKIIIPIKLNCFLNKALMKVRLISYCNKLEGD